MKILVILNGISRKRDKFLREIYPSLKNFQIQIQETEYAGHAEKIAASARGFDVILAAGGDGTMSQVVNGVLSSESNGENKGVTVGLVPLGSGNDLARSLKIEARHIQDLLKKNQSRLSDVGLLTFNDNSKRYFINECSIGMGPEVVRRIEASGSGNASVKYLSAIIRTFFNHKPQKIHVKTNDFEWDGDARVLAVANGKAFGHSIYIAPDAEMDDGKLNMFLCKGLPLVKFLLYLQAIKQPKKIDDHKWITYRQVEEITVTSPTPLPVEADGELIGFTPFVCRALQKKIKLLA